MKLEITRKRFMSASAILLSIILILCFYNYQQFVLYNENSIELISGGQLMDGTIE